MTRQLLFYTISGGIALAIHLAVLALLVEMFDIPKLIATTIGFLTAVPVHYVIQRNVVFRSKEKTYSEFGIYVLVTVAAMGFNAGLFALIYQLTSPYYLVTQIAVTALAFALNFFVNRYVTFARCSKARGLPSVGGEDQRV